MHFVAVSIEVEFKSWAGQWGLGLQDTNFEGIQFNP